MIVSVIVPIYNTAPYLSECLESIINQTYPHLDIILVDDGSTDRSLEIALEFASRDSRIIVASKPNGGQSSARNFGLELMRGSGLRQWVQNHQMEGRLNEIRGWDKTHTFQGEEKIITSAELEEHFEIKNGNFIQTKLQNIHSLVIQTLPNHFVHFVDSDDYLMPNSIAKLVSKAKNERLDICAYNLARYFENEKRMDFNHCFDIPNCLKAYSYERAIDAVVESGSYSFVFTVQGIFRASLLNLYNLRFIQGIYGEDNDFGVILFALAGRFAYLDEVGLVYRIHDSSSTSNVSPVIPEKIPAYLEVLRKDFQDYRELRRYFHTYCVALSGLTIEHFFRASTRDFSKAEKDFFENSLAWHLDLCRVSLKNDPLGILKLIATSGVNKRLLSKHIFRQILRHPKKLKNILNLFYLIFFKE